LTSLPSDASLNLVLKRGTAPVFRGGLTSRLSLLSAIPPRNFHNA
jgi:hypothetical protein